MNGNRLEELVHKVRAIEDTDSRDAALALIQGVMDLHAEALERMMEIIAESPSAEQLMDEFAGEAGVSNVLLLHSLHPHDLETRVRTALDGLASAGTVETIDFRAGTVHARIRGDASFEALVRQALTDAAPDAGGIVVEVSAPPAAGFVPLTQLLAGGVR